MKDASENNDYVSNIHRKGGWVLTLGWIIFMISILSWWSFIADNPGFPLLNWQKHPIDCLATLIAHVTGMNIFTIVAFFAGLQVWRRKKNLSGRILMYSSMAVYFVSFVAHLIFSFD